MTQAAYSPMHKPQKEVTQEDMWKTLAKHAPDLVQMQLSKTEAQTPKAESAIALKPLVWLDPVKTGAISGYVLSQCGRFSITKDSVHGKPMYMAWARREPPHASIALGVRLTRAEAEALCQ